MKKTLRQIFIDTFETSSQPVEEMAYDHTDGWDSLAHMALCAAIEENFDIMLEVEEIANMSTFAKVREILKKHGIFNEE